MIEEALSSAGEAYALLETLGNVEDGEATIRLALGESLVVSSDLSSARQVLQKAVQWLRKQASTIDNCDWRKSFLIRIPEHRRILELAREMGIADSD
jgi:hypothetical protein